MALMGRNLTLDHLEICFSYLTASLASSYDHVNSRSLVVELMTHPGWPLSPGDAGCCHLTGADAFSQSLDRLHELHLLTSYDFAHFLSSRGISIVNFSDL
ncbi:unnamed protein product [Protopolystoma xenopodis]|uniref:Carbohydrate deacetylase n=1 Tax=Protopolystoma xenopodis TaxID=117903 RepID=A0A3S5BPA5_9PLAT|nr:unnamed protein product [Protopolystoma xenopodis]